MGAITRTRKVSNGAAMKPCTAFFGATALRFKPGNEIRGGPHVFSQESETNTAAIDAPSTSKALG